MKISEERFKAVEKRIEELIKEGKIKSIDTLMKVSIDKLCSKYGICAGEFICYSCYTSNDNKCKYCK